EQAMSKPVPAIRSVKARSLVVPLARPVKNAFGVIDVGPLVLIEVETDQGVTGRSYIFAYSKLTLKPLVHMIEEIGRELIGKPVADEKALRRSLEQGFRGIKIKVGDGDATNDERMVKGVRALIGPDVALMIDFNQSLDPAEASRRIARLEPYDLHWIEEPVPQE